MSAFFPNSQSFGDFCLLYKTFNGLGMKLWNVELKSNRAADDFVVKISFARSSRPEVFCKKDVLKNFAKFTGKRLRPEVRNFIKKGLWLWILRNFKNTFFYRRPPVAVSVLWLPCFDISYLQRQSKKILLSNSSWGNVIFIKFSDVFAYQGLKKLPKIPTAINIVVMTLGFFFQISKM